MMRGLDVRGVKGGVVGAAVFLLVGDAAGRQPAGDPGAPPRDVGVVAAAAEEPMETDRPDFTEGTRTVPPGRLQFEMGYTFASRDEDGEETTTQTVPEALARIGLVENVELRLGWDGYEWVNVDGGPGVEDGFTDVEVGFKIRALEQAEFVPQLAFIPALTIPVGSEDQSSDQVDPSVIVAAAYDVSETVSVGANFGLAGVSDEEGDRFLETSVSAAVGIGITEWMDGFVEYYAIFPDEPGRGDEHVLDGGFTFPVRPNLQFDVRAGVGLSDAADDWLVGAGFAVRF